MMIDCLPGNVPRSDRNDTVLAEASDSINRAIQQVRSLSHLLHPPLLDEVGLRCALEPFLEGFSKRSGIETSVDVKPAEFPRLKSELETAIFRIVQESLTNVFRHSGANKASVVIEKSDREIVIAVRDNGKGLADNIVEFRPGSIGIGIAGMRQRVKEFGGEVRLRNVHPGALVEVVFPITFSSQVIRPAPALTT
jgi:signal transduction histidine kinase